MKDYMTIHMRRSRDKAIQYARGENHVHEMHLLLALLMDQRGLAASVIERLVGIKRAAFMAVLRHSCRDPRTRRVRFLKQIDALVVELHCMERRLVHSLDLLLLLLTPGTWLATICEQFCITVEAVQGEARLYLQLTK